MIVSFFGASVTQQKDGYVDVFSNLANNNIITKKIWIWINAYF